MRTQAAPNPLILLPLELASIDEPEAIATRSLRRSIPLPLPPPPLLFLRIKIEPHLLGLPLHHASDSHPDEEKLPLMQVLQGCEGCGVAEYSVGF